MPSAEFKQKLFSAVANRVVETGSDNGGGVHTYPPLALLGTITLLYEAPKQRLELRLPHGRTGATTVLEVRQEGSRFVTSGILERRESDPNRPASGGRVTARPLAEGEDYNRGEPNERDVDYLRLMQRALHEVHNPLGGGRF